MVETEGLARRKQERLSGGNVNYYLQVVSLPNGTVDVECEDIIEWFGMSFALATVFKSLWRLCKLRQDLGKPGSTHIYEAEKCVYYSERTWAVSGRKIKDQNPIARAIRKFLKSIQYGQYRPYAKIMIEDPKRLAPYSFLPDQFIRSMTEHHVERSLFHSIFAVAWARKKYPHLLLSEFMRAQDMVSQSNSVVLFVKGENRGKVQED